MQESHHFRISVRVKGLAIDGYDLRFLMLKLHIILYMYHGIVIQVLIPLG